MKSVHVERSINRSTRTVNPPSWVLEWQCLSVGKSKPAGTLNVCHHRLSIRQNTWPDHIPRHHKRSFSFYALRYIRDVSWKWRSRSTLDWLRSNTVKLLFIGAAKAAPTLHGSRGCRVLNECVSFPRLLRSYRIHMFAINIRVGYINRYIYFPPDFFRVGSVSRRHFVEPLRSDYSIYGRVGSDTVSTGIRWSRFGHMISPTRSQNRAKFGQSQIFVRHATTLQVRLKMRQNTSTSTVSCDR